MLQVDRLICGVKLKKIFVFFCGYTSLFISESNHRKAPFSRNNYLLSYNLRSNKFLGSGRVSERLMSCSRYLVLVHEGLRPVLVGLDLGPRLCRAEALDSVGCESVDDAVGEWVFWANDGQCYCVVFAPFC